ncbi:MAG TPA: sulfotransferase [Blastocatellia bacterium]|nr:sulfotransferase [Blastocatellia bacterium]
MGLDVRRQPIILMGMHRSGTTMLARLLDQLGLFLGHEVEENHEAVFFLRLNDLLLSRAKATWDHPAPFRDFLKNPELVEMTVRCLRADLLSVKVRRYLGWWGYLRYGSVTRLDRPWGWKDPRNVFTLPLWLRLFPRARILYIYRNGVDVAHSLQVRERAYFAWQKQRLRNKLNRWSPKTRLERVGFRGSFRCLSLEGCFSLWEEYVAQAEEVLASLVPEHRVIKYEEFLAHPLDHLREIADFCEIPGVSERALRETAALVRPDRGHAFAATPSLRVFYHQVKRTPWMIRYGYGEGPTTSDHRGVSPRRVSAG